MSYLLTIDSGGYWCLAAENDPIYYLRVEYSKSGRAKCRACSELIKSKTLRIGKPVKWRGIITSWVHPECFFRSNTDKYIDIDTEIVKHNIHGFRNLKKQEQSVVTKVLKRTTPPDHLKPDEEDEITDGAFQARKKIEKLEQPDTLCVKLLPFQEEGLGWMVAQELNLKVKGGILADEMGMGKTIQTIALLLEQMRRNSSNSKSGPTLVVCPASAMLQWQEEIKRCSLKDTLKVFVFHGSLRSYITPREINEMDVILTTYPTLEYAYRMSANAQKVNCEYCSKKFLYPKLILHNKYFCGPNSKRSLRLAKTDRAEKQEAATKKAMVTLKITGNSLPTPANIYRELMHSANRVPVSMYTKKEKAAEIQSLSKFKREVEEVEPLEVKTFPAEKVLWSCGSIKFDEIFFLRMTAVSPSEKKKLGLIDGEYLLLSNLRLNTVSTKGYSYGCYLGTLKEIENESVLCLRPAKTSIVEGYKYTVSRAVEVRLYDERVTVTRDNGANWTTMKGKWLPSCPELSTSPFNKPVISHSEAPPGIRLGVATKTTKNGRRTTVHVEDTLGGETTMTKTNFLNWSKKTNVISYFEMMYDKVDSKASSPLNILLIDNSSTEKKSSRTKQNKKKKIKRVQIRTSSDSDSEYIDSEQDSDSSYSSVEVKKNTTVNAQQPIDYVIPEVSFLPVNWGPNSKKFDELLDYHKAKRGYRKVKKRKKGSKKKKAKKKKRICSASTSKDVDEVYNNELEVVSSSDESVVNEISSNPKNANEPFRYAEKGTIIDDDGVDLGFSLLHSISWGRIILDEAHKIKDRTNSTAKATFALKGWEEVTADPVEEAKVGLYCRRWCLSGTPIQNRVGEMYALIRFLRLDPFGYYFCSVKECDCKCLNWSFGPENRKCRFCGHPPLRHYSHFNKMIMNPIKRSGFVGAGKKAMKILRYELLENVMLRRTKVERKNDLKLPELSISVVKLNLTAAEKDFYESVYMNTRSKFDTFVKKGTLLHNYAHIFELLSRLRRSADHPYLVIHGGNKTLQVADTSQTEKQQEIGLNDEYKLEDINTKSAGASDVCAICNLDITDLKEVALSFCRHTFHKACVKKFTTENLLNKVVSECPSCFQPLKVSFGFKDGKSEDTKANENYKSDDALCVICFDNPRNALILPCGHLFTCTTCLSGLKNKLCPMCREPIKKVVKSHRADSKERNTLSPDSKSKSVVKNLLGRRSILQKISLENFESSTKIDAVITELHKMKSLPVPEGEPPHKAIIFSQYSDMIDLVEWKLRVSGIKPVKLVGSMSIKERQAVLKAFRESDDIIVILMSLKAGGEGLNLQIASHVFILECWWNPQVHNQAYQRAHRIGQNRNVRAVLFVTENTIEDRMHELQEKKELVFKGAVDGNSKAIQQLTEEDLRFLFS